MNEIGQLLGGHDDFIEKQNEVFRNFAKGKLLVNRPDASPSTFKNSGLRAVQD